MKYLSKTVISDFLDNPSLMRFHSLFFHTGARMFSCSRYLSLVMRRINKSPGNIRRVLFGDFEIYNSKTTTAFPCKYQSIKKVKYKYQLLPFEIKSNIERVIYHPFIDNYQMRQWFERVDEIISICSLRPIGAVI